MSHRLDLIVLATLTALALVCVAVLAALHVVVPDVFGYVVAACVGALTGASFPRSRAIVPGARKELK